VPEQRAEHRSDGIAYYNKSRAVDEPMIAAMSTDCKWVVASFTRTTANVWSQVEGQNEIFRLHPHPISEYQPCTVKSNRLKTNHIDLHRNAHFRWFAARISGKIAGEFSCAYCFRPSGRVVMSNLSWRSPRT
jgi:hypothetical protein